MPCIWFFMKRWRWMEGRLEAIVFLRRYLGICSKEQPWYVCKNNLHCLGKCSKEQRWYMITELGMWVRKTDSSEMGLVCLGMCSKEQPWCVCKNILCFSTTLVCIQRNSLGTSLQSMYVRKTISSEMSFTCLGTCSMEQPWYMFTMPDTWPKDLL